MFLDQLLAGSSYEERPGFCVGLKARIQQRGRNGGGEVTEGVLSPRRLKGVAAKMWSRGSL